MCVYTVQTKNSNITLFKNGQKIYHSQDKLNAHNEIWGNETWAWHKASACDACEGDFYSIPQIVISLIFIYIRFFIYILNE